MGPRGRESLMGGPTVCVVGAGTAGLEGLLAARERLGESELRTFTAHEHAVVHELQQHGYLQHRDARSVASRRRRDRSTPAWWGLAAGRG